MTEEALQDVDTPPPEEPKRWTTPPRVIAALVVFLVLALLSLQLRMERRTNEVALADEPKAVTVVRARATSYQPERRFVGTVEPWHRAEVGPQFLSAYVREVTARPGAPVVEGQILAELDCRDARTAAEVLTSELEAMAVEQKAATEELRRTEALAERGFVSANELSMQRASGVARRARVAAGRAAIRGRGLLVDDCTLRAPFDGEIAARHLDPGAFVTPGASILTVVDRREVRLVVDAAESDWEAITPGTEVEVRFFALDREEQAMITRRAPAARRGTRTVRFEVDLKNEDRALPVGISAELRVGLGVPVEAVELPLSAARVTGREAMLFVVQAGRALERRVPVLGERRGALYLASELGSGTWVVTEGRYQLREGDPVRAAGEPIREAGGAPVRHRAEAETRL